MQVRHYWVFTSSAGFQFILHVLFWWSLWSIRGTATINFLSYLFLLSGPVLLFVSSAMLAPNLSEDEIDLRAHYFQARPVYSSVLILAWLWAILVSPFTRCNWAEPAPGDSVYPRLQYDCSAINIILAGLRNTWKVPSSSKTSGPTQKLNRRTHESFS